MSGLRYRRRGRPRKETWKNCDIGTAELIFKRAHNLTAEPLDLCLERGIITQEQHWCGVHLRWLHTVRFGAAGVRAVDTTHMGGMECRPEQPQWRAEREAEYHEALRLLGSHGHTVISLAIYHAVPECLLALPGHTGLRQAALWSQKAKNSATHLQEGFNKLVRLWCRNA